MNTPDFLVNKPSRALRLWHWCTVLNVLLLFYSVFVAKMWVNPYQNAMIIHMKLQEQGLLNGKDPAPAIAQSLGQGAWDWHVRYGYVLAVLLLFRLIFEWWQQPHQRWVVGLRLALRARRQKEQRSTAVHYLIVRMLYLFFYATLIFIVGTGLWLAFHRHSADFAQVHAVQQVHGIGFYVLLLFIPIHVIGVLLAERRWPYRNLVSTMIHGGKDRKVSQRR